MKTAGIVLSAGRSSRMGTPKFAVDLQGATLLRRCLDSLAAAGADPLVVVGRREHVDALRQAARPHAPVVAVNPDPDGGGMRSSVRTGLSAAGGGRSYVLPVDCPLVAPSTCALLAAAVRGTEAAAAVPEHRGRRGHPVLLGPDVARAVLGDGEGTLAQVLAAFGERVRVVPVDDPAVTDNVNRPEDVQGLRQRLVEEDAR